MNRTSPRLKPWFLIALCTACGSSRSASRAPKLRAGPGPQFTLVDSIVLEENDTLYLGKPEMSFVVDDSGLIYVADDFWNRVMRFKPDGRIDRVFGRAGSGPGEFRSTTPATIVFDTLVIQGSSGRLKVFNRNNGQFYFERPFARGVLMDGRRQGDHVVLALYDFGARRGVLSWPLDDLLHSNPESGAAPPSANMVDLPPEYLQYPGLQDFAATGIVLWADSMMVGFAGLDYLVLYGSNGIPSDTVDIPVRVRRAITPATLAIFARGKSPSLQQEVGALAQFMRMWRLSNGETLLWYQQNRVVQSGSQVKFFGDAYLTLLAADRRSACIDTRLPFPGSDWPRLAVHGDTLLAMDQIMTGKDSLKATTVLRRYVVEDAQCKWIPIRPRH